LANRGLDPICVTLKLPYEFGVSQMVKIADLKQRFSLSHTVQMSLGETAPSPLSRLFASSEPRPFYQHDSVYREAFETLAQYLESYGVKTVFTGIGGDELCAYNEQPLLATGEGPAAQLERSRKPLWPFLNENFRAYYMESVQKIPQERRNAVPIVATTSLAARLTHNNIYIEHNIWPVAPLADPRLFLYSQGLPLQYRANKNILRMYCTANQYPASLYNDTRNEHFGIFFMQSARQYYGLLLNRVLENSVLAKANFLKVDEVLEWFRRIELTPSQIDEAYYDAHRLITLEYNLQLLGVSPRGSGL